MIQYNDCTTTQLDQIVLPFWNDLLHNEVRYQQILEENNLYKFYLTDLTIDLSFVLTGLFLSLNNVLSASSP